MKTLTASMLLSVMFLSAGAFAGSGTTPNFATAAKPENVTVIEKNQSWPLAGRISVEPCNIRRCVEI